MPFDLYGQAANMVARRRKNVRANRSAFYPTADVGMGGSQPPPGATTIGGDWPGSPPDLPGSEDWNRGRGGKRYGDDERGTGGVYGDSQTGGAWQHTTPPPQGYTPTPGGYSSSGSSAQAQIPNAEAPQDVNDWLHSIISGEGESFDPIRDELRAQEDAARRRLAEMYASRGMGMSGALAGGLADITGDFARKQAEAYMNWRQQQIQNKFAAAQMLFQDYWKKLSFDQQKALAELMFELDRKAKYGDDYDPRLGDYEMQLLRDLAQNPELGEAGKRFIQRAMGMLGYWWG